MLGAMQIKKANEMLKHMNVICGKLEPVVRTVADDALDAGTATDILRVRVAFMRPYTIKQLKTMIKMKGIAMTTAKTSQGRT